MTDALSRIGEDAAALASVAERAPDLPVPACPDWTVADVASHVGRVHRLFTAAVRGGLTPRPQIDVETPEVAALPGWVRAGAGALVDALESADPDRPVWNWTGTPEVPAWVRRRMLHETAVHRWDAESAMRGHGAPPLPPDVAADGVDEFFEVIVAHRTEPWAGEAVGLRLEQADGAQRWLVRTREGLAGVEVVRSEAETGAADVDAVVRASASGLLLLLWRRLPREAVERAGDETALARLLAWTRL